MLPVPSKETPPIVLAVSRAVAVAAFPEVSWLPAWFTPGKLMLALPSKETPPIVLAVSRVDAVEALPVKSPVTSPTTPPVAVVTPVTTSPVAVACPRVEIPVTLSCSKLPPEPPPRTYSLTRDSAALRLVPPAPSSTTIKSASSRSAPISVPPSISRVVRGVVPADSPEPEPLKEEAVIIPAILILPVPVISLTVILGVPVSPSALVAVVAVPVTSPVTLPVKLPVTSPVTSPVKSPVTFIVPLVATNEDAVTIPERFKLSPVIAPATLRESRVPTDVSEELATFDPRVVALRTSVLLIL